MTFSIHGLAVARGIAIGRAVLVASSRVDVAHYFIEATPVDAELARLSHSRQAVMAELQQLHDNLPKESPPELAAILEVHLMLLDDTMLADGVAQWVKDRLYNAEWALTSQLDVVARQFDEMDDAYLRERKGDLEQVVERMLRHMKGIPHVMPQVAAKRNGPSRQQDLQLGDDMDVPLVLVAHDLSPADMLQFKQSVFAGFVTDVGGKTSHTAIVALTHDPKLDDMALLTALNSSAFYVGALGSRRNQQARKQRLAEHFDLSEPALARLHGPVGLRLGAKTPAEIAVSIMAEIVQVKNKGASDARVEPRATDTTESPHPVCTV